MTEQMYDGMTLDEVERFWTGDTIHALTAHIRELQAENGRLLKLADIQESTIQEQQAKDAAPKLIGWRTANYLWETADIQIAQSWEPHIEVLPIFEGDPNTKITAKEERP